MTTLADFWTTDEMGRNITRYQAQDALIDDVIGNHYSPLDDLIETLKVDPRKLFSKSAILELIEEVRG